MSRRQRALLSAARRRVPVAFWHLGREQLVVATLQAGDDEPLLLSCSAVRVEWVGPSDVLCPGLLELSRQSASRARLHAAALAPDDDAEATDVVEIEAGCGRVQVSRARIDSVADRFRAARLRLVTLECEAAARDCLARFFGSNGGKRAGERSLADDPLAAVSVSPACEGAAAALGKLLVVPVGLALACFRVTEEP